MTSKVINIATNTVIVIIIAFMAMMYVPRLFGVTPYVVLSGSMEPTYHVGSLIFVDEDFDKIEVNDSITFYMNSNTLVTHRVIEIDEEKQLYTTKGDANNTADFKPVAYNNIVGVPKFTIPYLGYVAVYVVSFEGKIALASLVALMILISYMPTLFGKKNITSSQVSKIQINQYYNGGGALNKSKSSCNKEMVLGP